MFGISEFSRDDSFPVRLDREVFKVFAGHPGVMIFGLTRREGNGLFLRSLYLKLTKVRFTKAAPVSRLTRYIVSPTAARKEELAKETTSECASAARRGNGVGAVHGAPMYTGCSGNCAFSLVTL
jgi:hypothetical protein